MDLLDNLSFTPVVVLLVVALVAYRARTIVRNRPEYGLEVP
jgi:hypothetical protein